MPGLAAAGAWRLLSAARVARLATVTAAGLPHIVPVTFAVHDGVIYTAVDAKPKSTRLLRRLDNIRHNPGVAVLADHYEDDWAALWWVRADGSATFCPMQRTLLIAAGLSGSLRPRDEVVLERGQGGCNVVPGTVTANVLVFS